MTEASHHEVNTRSAVAVGRVGLAVLLAVGVVSLIGAFTTLEIGTPAAPGPGLWIAAVSACGVALCIAGLVAPGIAADDVEPISKLDLRHLALAVPALVLTVPVLDFLGITLTVFLLGLYWLKVPMGMRWIRSLIASALVTASIYVIFILLLEVPFPRGSLTGF